MQWVNEDFAVFNKSTGALVFGPVAGNTLWAGFGGGCQTNNDGDPIVQYDQLANRWIMTQFSVSTTPFLQCVAVSTTSDATGSYNRYSFSYTNFPDYPKLGVWPDGYYISYNMFNGNTFVGSRACAFDRTKCLLARPPHKSASNSARALVASCPPIWMAALYHRQVCPTTSSRFGTNVLQSWQFHVDFTTPANSTFTGPTNLSVASFSAACSGGGTCIRQPSTNQRLDSLADRLMYRLAYRNHGGVQSLVVNHSVLQAPVLGYVGTSCVSRGLPSRSSNREPSLPTRLPLDGQHRDGQSRRHRPGL